MEQKSFAKYLLDWYEINGRDLPWRNTKDPYKIWLSEIILQQTRIEQGLPYYLKFIQNFPDIIHFASASDQEILKAWEGLGYYSRARNMIKTAKTIISDYGGKFPNTYSELLSLQGIGPYTAAAIASFAFGIPKGVVDGNVLRLICRLEGIELPIDHIEVKTLVTKFVDTAISTNRAGDFNQALMDFGSLVCTPRNPKCGDCPFQNYCIAYDRNLTDILPIKKKKILKRERYFHYIVIEDIAEKRMLIHQRGEGDIWQSLFDFPLIETTSTKKISNHQVIEKVKSIFENVQTFHSLHQEFVKSQLLTHQKINFAFYLVKLDSELNTIEQPNFWIDKSNYFSFSFPKTIKTYIWNKFSSE